MRLVKEGEYQICTRCIMDSSDPDIYFDEKGICNHCHLYDDLIQNHIPSGEKAKAELNALVAKIKKDGEGKPYDSIIGLSGGVDSSYVAWLVKDLGLRPLAVHLDNGWNSELAVMNVENIVNKLGLDLYTIVIDWDEFRDLQLAYLRASVIDLEATSDHAIVATMFKLAHKNKIKYIINGTNVATECILPHAWYYKYKTDSFNLLDIYKKFGSNRKLKTYPLLPFYKMMYYTFFLNLKWVSILNYVDYNKSSAIELITNKLGWKNYGGKHHESIITKFYQAYILPQKTGFDKRRAHLSNLVCSGQLTRMQALEEMKLEVYKSKSELESEKEYVIKKLGISMEQFNEILSQPARNHTEFKTNQSLMKWVQRLNFVLIKLGLKKF
jgi:N-acetyl sugar amidotransferase